MRKIRRISFECRLDNSYSRSVLRGIIRFARVYGPWDLRTIRLSVLLEEMEHWKVDGVIVCTHDDIVPLIRASGLPAVKVLNTDADGDMPQIATNNFAVGQMGAEHFLERGFRQFAFSGILHEVYSQGRRTGFVQTLREAGFDCFMYQADRTIGNWRKRGTLLHHWLKSLPKPIGLMACNDRRAWHAAETCLHLGLRIPEQVAILGVGNDPFFCETPYPSLSSIALPTDRIGSEAAALLTRLMKGETAPGEPILIPPLGVATRQSTNTLAIEDQDVAQAINFIREHADKPIQVEDVLASVAVSRRVLEQRFRQLLKRSPHEEIRRVHVERAKALLAESEMSIHNVALASGFMESKYFSSVFHERTGLTPTLYRQKFGRAE